MAQQIHFWGQHGPRELPRGPARTRSAQYLLQEEVSLVKGYPTSFAALFEASPEATPRCQRASRSRSSSATTPRGAPTAAVKEIRSNFLDVLHEAVTGGEPVGLDFVYGEVENGTLRPLDGQQRLTTLFLLHWYLALRTDRLD